LKYLVCRGSKISNIIHKRGLNNELKIIDDKTEKELYKSSEKAIQA